MYNYQIEEETLTKIRLELEQIDLDKTLRSIPDLGNDNNRFLRDLIGFKLNSELFYDVFSDSLKANKEATETYTLFAGLPAYLSLRSRTLDYYWYTTYNYMLVDRYRENSNLFDLYARTILTSVSTPDKELPLPIRGISSGNLHAESLVADDIHLILRFTNSSELNVQYIFAGGNS